MRCVVIFAVAILAGTGVAATKELHQNAMNADGLRKAVVGKALHFATPAGNLSIMFQTDGAMSASAGQLAAYTGFARDQGHWWIAADELCQRWNNWFGGKSYCFRLRQVGQTVHWTRNDGLSGTATLIR